MWPREWQARRRMQGLVGFVLFMLVIVAVVAWGKVRRDRMNAELFGNAPAPNFTTQPAFTLPFAAAPEVELVWMQGGSNAYAVLKNHGASTLTGLRVVFYVPQEVSQNGLTTGVQSVPTAVTLGGGGDSLAPGAQQVVYPPAPIRTFPPDCKVTSNGQEIAFRQTLRQ